MSRSRTIVGYVRQSTHRIDRVPKTSEAVGPSGWIAADRPIDQPAPADATAAEVEAAMLRNDGSMPGGSPSTSAATN
jgi:hypothetical protein